MSALWLLIDVIRASIRSMVVDEERGGQTRLGLVLCVNYTALVLMTVMTSGYLYNPCC